MPPDGQTAEWYVMKEIFVLAALFGPAGDAAEPEAQTAPAAAEIEPFLTLRSGVWAGTGFNFEAVTGSVRREIETSALFSAGVDAGLAISERFLVFGFYEVNLAEDIFCDLAGACIGYREHGEEGGNPSVPIATTIYAGGMWGRFDVNAEGYDFEDAWGFRAGIAFSWRAAPGLTVDLIGEYRLIEFDCKEKPDSGDDKVGGSTGWLGLGLQYRF